MRQIPENPETIVVVVMMGSHGVGLCILPKQLGGLADQMSSDLRCMAEGRRGMQATRRRACPLVGQCKQTATLGVDQPTPNENWFGYSALVNF